MAACVVHNNIKPRIEINNVMRGRWRRRRRRRLQRRRMNKFIFLVYIFHILLYTAVSHLNIMYMVSSNPLLKIVFRDGEGEAIREAYCDIISITKG